ncbi:PI31 proteasome regulator [Toxoplasma gondii GAB2-2007-GAL-DOM2]|uniref:PI31 proteasome regulator n=3 Tax=Toxoplasma gondii TaxID=5811 RepID=V4YR31_TOXGV|nr:PI31 proteasome regulator [Toxoplasma gondii VEG]KFG40419.1 PI31 proteasome regulator [Toxoplasma gondii GAB2-2007-GAL-DOM2]
MAVSTSSHFSLRVKFFVAFLLFLCTRSFRASFFEQGVSVVCAEMNGPDHQPVSPVSQSDLSRVDSETNTFQSLLLLKSTPFRDAAEALTLAVHSAFLDRGFLPVKSGARAEQSCRSSQKHCSELSTPSGEFVRLPDGRVARVVYDPADFPPEETNRSSFTVTILYARPHTTLETQTGKKPDALVQVKCTVVGHSLEVTVSDGAQEGVLTAEFPLEAAEPILELDSRRTERKVVLSADTGEGSDAPEEETAALRSTIKSLHASIEEGLVAAVVRAYMRSGKMDPSDCPSHAQVGSSAPPLSPTGPEPLSCGTDSVRSPLPPQGPRVGGQDLRPPGIPDLTRRPEEDAFVGPDRGEGGTHVGPRHPFFSGGNRQGSHPYPTPPLPPGFVPGTSYDPIGPFGVEPNPDHERPQRWDNRGDVLPSPGGAGFLGGPVNFGGGRWGGGGGGFGGGGFGGGII